MFPTCQNSQKRVKNQKSTDKHSSFDGLIQEDIDLSDIYLAVKIVQNTAIKMNELLSLKLYINNFLFIYSQKGLRIHSHGGRRVRPWEIHTHKFNVFDRHIFTW